MLPIFTEDERSPEDYGTTRLFNSEADMNNSFSQQTSSRHEQLLGREQTPLLPVPQKPEGVRNRRVPAAPIEAGRKTVEKQTDVLESGAAAR